MHFKYEKFDFKMYTSIPNMEFYWLLESMEYMESVDYLFQLENEEGKKIKAEVN